MKRYTDFIIDINQLKTNVQNIKKRLGPAKYCSVIKANAYGLGMETVASCLKGIADFFAVACLKEALALRVFDKTSPILILGCVEKSDIKACVDNNISISVSNILQLKELVGGVGRLNIHLQVNTGLNRFGFRVVSEFKKAVEIINNSDNLFLEGVYSHFATKSNDVNFIKKQYYRFLQFKSCVRNKDVIFHISNSFATIYDDVFHMNMARVGFLQYGELENNIDCKPVLSIKSKLINVFTAKKGDTIGYDRTYKVNKTTKVGVVPVGYADGFDRRLSNNFCVLINNVKCKVVGLVCMDVFMVDLSGVAANIGDEVLLLGGRGKNKITLNDYALAMKTSPYEVLLGFNYKRLNYTVK